MKTNNLKARFKLYFSLLICKGYEGTENTYFKKYVSNSIHPQLAFRMAFKTDY